MRYLALALFLTSGLFYAACSSDDPEEDNGRSSGGETNFTATACTEKSAGVLCECIETDKPNDLSCPTVAMLNILGEDGGVRKPKTGPPPICCADETAKSCSCQVAGCESTGEDSICTCGGNIFNPNIGECKKPKGGVCCLNKTKSSCVCLPQPACPQDNQAVDSCSLAAVPNLCGPLKQVGKCSTN